MDAAAPPTRASVPDLRALADDVFERTSPYEGFGFRNHCRRLHRFATMLMEQRGLTGGSQPSLPGEVAYVIAMWHDLGIVSEKDEGHNYLQRSRALFHRECEGIELGEVDLGVVDECLLYNHRVLPVPGVAPEADCFRQAVIIEHARGLKRYGLDRREVRAVYDEFPRGNFDAVLLDFTRRTVRREPLTLVRGVFF